MGAPQKSPVFNRHNFLYLAHRLPLDHSTEQSQNHSPCSLSASLSRPCRPLPARPWAHPRSPLFSLATISSTSRIGCRWIIEMNSRRTSPTEATRSVPRRAVPCRANPRDALPADVVSEMSTLKPNLPYSLIGPVNSGVETLGRSCHSQDSTATCVVIIAFPLCASVEHSHALQ